MAEPAWHVVLVHPDIAGNTGNIGRTCLALGCRLHLVAPLGFRLDDRELRRAGLDYHEYASVAVHASWDACREALGTQRVFAFSTRAASACHAARFQPGDALLFGPESRGLPAAVLEGFMPARRLRLL